MGPDPRIADFISANRARLTREAITQQLRDAGYSSDAIDATWAVLDTPDADDVVGEGFWARFWIYLIGLNLAAFLLVGLLTGMIPNSTILAVVLGIALAIGAFITLGVISLIRPTRMGRGAAIAVGAIVPLFFTFLIAGACYAMVGSMGPLPPAPQRGTVTLRIDPPLPVEAAGPVSCQLPPEGESYYTVFTESPMSTSEGPVSVFVNAFPEREGGEPVPMVSITIGDPSQAGGDFLDYQPGSGGGAGIEVEPGSGATSGALSFDGFLPAEAFDEQGQPIDRFDADPISGTIQWSCES
jgi:hypothetical protein